MDGTELQGISRAGQTVLARLTEFQIWHLPASSVALPTFLSGRSCLPALALMPTTSVPPSMPLVPFKLLLWCWNSEGVSLGKFMCGFFKSNCLELQKFLLPTQHLLIFAARSYGPYLNGTGILGWGPCVGLGPLTPEISLPNFSTTWVCGTSPFCIFTPPTSLDRCGFFNFVVGRLLFNLISAGCE